MAMTSTMSGNGRASRVHVPALGWSLSLTLVILFLICMMLAIMFPSASLAHVFSDAPIGSGRTLVEGIAGSILLAWILAIVFGLTYNRLLPRH